MRTKLFLSILLLSLSTVYSNFLAADGNHSHEEQDHSHADEQNDHQTGAESMDERFANSERSDLNFKQLMEGFGEGTVLMQEGILRQNKLLVDRGSKLILGHKPPYHQPWIIVAKENQEAFKQMLRANNPVFHQSPEAIATAAKQGKWPQAQQKMNDMTASCVACHTVWKNKVVGYPPLQPQENKEN